MGDKQGSYDDILRKLFIDFETLCVQQGHEYMKISPSELTVGFVKHLRKKHSFEVTHKTLEVISPREKFTDCSRFKSEWVKVISKRTPNSTILSDVFFVNQSDDEVVIKKKQKLESDCEVDYKKLYLELQKKYGELELYCVELKHQIEVSLGRIKQ